LSPVVNTSGGKPKPVGPHPTQDDPVPTLEQAPDPEPEPKQDDEQNNEAA
jgi:hypothetical protein